MPTLSLYTHPRSRGRIARWMLEEIGQPYDTTVLPYGVPMKTPDFAAGPLEAAITDKALGLQVAPEKQGFVGYGNAQLTEDTLAQALAGRSFIAGDRFSAADVYLCASLDFALAFGNLPKRPEFVAYCAAHAQRPARLRAAALDDAALKA